LIAAASMMAREELREDELVGLTHERAAVRRRAVAGSPPPVAAVLDHDRLAETLAYALDEMPHHEIGAASGRNGTTTLMGHECL
jgi:hypothetical protein